VANVTRRPVFGSVHRIVPRSTTMLRTSGRADCLHDDAFAGDPATRHGGDRLGTDGDGGLPRRLAPTRGPRRHGVAEQRSLNTGRTRYDASLATSRAIGKVKPVRRHGAGALPVRPRGQSDCTRQCPKGIYNIEIYPMEGRHPASPTLVKVPGGGRGGDDVQPGGCWRAPGPRPRFQYLLR
jgi:hypothetical protein